MTKKASKQKFREKRELAEVQNAFLSVHDPKLLKKRQRQSQDYMLTLFVPSDLVSVRPVGDKHHVFVRDSFREKHTTRFGKWRQFHNANPAIEKCQGLPYTGITAPLTAWHGVAMFYANRVMAADLPGGRDWKPAKQRAA